MILFALMPETFDAEESHGDSNVSATDVFPDAEDKCVSDLGNLSEAWQLPQDTTGHRDSETATLLFPSQNHFDEARSSVHKISNDTAAKVASRPARRSRTGKTTLRGHVRTIVRHNYRDWSKESTSASTEPRKVKSGNPPSFPSKLHTMLEDAEARNLTHIVSWQSHGRAFRVHDQDKFSTEIMPKYFRQTRFASFQRQLSLYGFLRLVRQGPDHKAYYHELFLRGRTDLSAKMLRTRVKGHLVRKTSSPDSEPDFYQMEPIGLPPASPEGLPPSGLPSPGLPSSGLPSAGLPSAGLPSAGLPSAGLPSVGLPSAGLPSVGLPFSSASSLTTENAILKEQAPAPLLRQPQEHALAPVLRREDSQGEDASLRAHLWPQLQEDQRTHSIELLQLLMSQLAQHPTTAPLSQQNGMYLHPPNPSAQGLNETPRDVSSDRKPAARSSAPDVPTMASAGLQNERSPRANPAFQSHEGGHTHRALGMNNMRAQEPALYSSHELEEISLFLSDVGLSSDSED